MIWRKCEQRPRDPARWEALLRLHGPSFSRIVRRVAWRFGIQDHGDIEDGMQEACCKLSTMAGRVRNDLANGELEAYLKTLVANAAHDYFRSFMRGPGLPQPLPEGDRVPASAEADVDRRILLEQLSRLAGVSQRDRTIFRLYFQQGLTAREISRLPSIGLTTEGVESIIHRMVARLRQSLAKDNYLERE